MATVELRSKSFVEIKTIDADWDHGATDRIYSIKFYPGAANDEVLIFDGLVTGVKGCHLKSTDGEPRIEYFGGIPWRPVIDESESTLSAGHRVVIVLHR